MRELHLLKMRTMGQAILGGFLTAIFCLSVASCHPKREKKWHEIQNLLWENPDSCFVLTTNLLHSPLSQADSLMLTVLHEHTNLRMYQCLSEANDLEQVATCLEYKHKEFRYAGEAYYLLGTNVLLNGDVYTATYYLKQAEEMLLSSPTCDSLLLGIVYYRLGCAAEEERLYEFAQKYYMQSLEYLRNTDNTLYLACAYRDAALTLPAEMPEGQNELLDSALFYTNLSGNDLMLQELEYAIDKIKGKDKAELIHQDKLLCDSFARFSHAANLIPFYLENKDFDSAYYYLYLLAEDTLLHAWSKEQYYYLHAALLEAIGEKDSAIYVLQKLHQWQTLQIEDNAYTRTYAIAQQFDLLREQNKSLQLQIEKTRQYFIFITILTILLICLVVSIFVYYRKRMAYQTTLFEKGQIQKVLQAQLQERLMLSKELNRALLSNNNEELPSWAQSYYSSLRLSILEQDKIIENANLAYSNIIENIHRNSPQVSKSDLLLMALILFGFTIEDCCILLDSSKEAMWKRRKRLRQRLSLGPDTNLDEWIRQQQVS